MNSKTLLLLACALIGNQLLAAHLPGGNITYTCLGGSQFEITLTLFRDCDGNELLPQDLSFQSDCGTSFTITDLPVSAGNEVSQLCPADLPNSTCNGGTLPGIEVYEVQTTVILGTCSNWTISWEECCRSSSLNLMGNPGTYIEAQLNTVSAPCNNSPQFTQDVIPYVCANEPVTYNLAVTEADGHELRYHLIDARATYSMNVEYLEDFTGPQPYLNLVIDSLSGQITFTPTEIGKIFTVVQVDEFLSNGVLVGSVMRDFPFVVIDCPNVPPDASGAQMSQISGDTLSTGPMSITICPDGDFCFNAVISDADALQLLTLQSNVEAVVPGATFTVTGSNPATATVCGNGSGLTAGSFGFVITAEDNACPTTGLTTYAYTLNILSNNEAECLNTPVIDLLEKHTKWSAWPSPANDRIFVEFDSDRTAELHLYDATGRCVMQRSIAPGRTPIEIGHLLPGMHVAQLIQEGMIAHERVMIAR